MSFIGEIRLRAPRSCTALLAFASFLRVLFTLFLLAAIQLRPACGQSTMETPAKSAMNNSLRSQHFVCNVGYSGALCHQQSVKLANVLVRYQQELPDNWTWVLVRSDDWSAILRGLNLNSGSPAFSVLNKRQTFLTEVLIDGTAQDRAELLRTFRVPVDRMLDVAVSHELGHAFCMEASEREADRFAEELRNTGVAQCSSARNPSTRDSMRTLGPPK